MTNTTAILVAEAPSYALNGSQGYYLRDGESRRRGWIRVGDDGRTVYATIQAAPWQVVGTVGHPAELDPAWVTQRGAEILRHF